MSSSCSACVAARANRAASMSTSNAALGRFPAGSERESAASRGVHAAATTPAGIAAACQPVSVSKDASRNRLTMTSGLRHIEGNETPRRGRRTALDEHDVPGGIGVGTQQQLQRSQRVVQRKQTG